MKGHAALRASGVVARRAVQELSKRHWAKGNHSLPLRLVVYARSSAAMDGSGLREAEGARATGGFRLSRIGGAASIGADGQKQGARAWLSVPASARRTCQDACDSGGTRRLGNAFSGGEGPLSVVVLDAEASAE